MVSYIAIGRNIRQARKQAGLTQEKLAEQMGISLLTYGRMERGERRITLEHLTQVGFLLGISYETLLCGAVMQQIPAIRSKSSLGTIISFLSSGCSEEACSLMVDLCQVVALRDKYSDSQR